jgi:hypothetical protein
MENLATNFSLKLSQKERLLSNMNEQIPAAKAASDAAISSNENR